MAELENVFGWFYKQPERIMTFGVAFFSLGSVLLFVGLAGHLMVTLSNMGRQIAKLSFNTSLNNAYPEFPSWWIPESYIGYLLALLLIAVGLFLKAYGKKFKRQMRL